MEAFADIVASVEYYDRDEKEIKTVSAEDVRDTMTALGEGSSDLNPKWYVVKEAVTINDRITVTGNVHLILADKAALTAKKGIDVSAGNSLTIYAQTDMLTENTGKIAATTSDYNAGIGGSEDKDGGSIKITGGEVIANSRFGAGIGAGDGGATGSFRTGADGKALIKANSISDTSDEANWKGIIFKGTSGKVYGEQELLYDFSVGGGDTLEIPSGSKLTIPQGKTLELNHSAKLENNGTLENNGKIKKKKAVK
ncbi:MAG: hypothetical protein ACTTKP_00010 [Catonella sp.]